MAVRWKVREERGRWFRIQHRILYSTSQHSTAWRSDGKFVRKGAGGFEFSTESSIPPASTVPHGGQMESSWGKGQVVSNSAQNPLFQQSTQYHTVVRWKACEERGKGFRSFVGAATSIIFVATKGFVATNMCLSRHNTSFVMTKVCLSQQKFYHNKSVVVTNIILSWRKFCHNKHNFVATKDVFCWDKHVFVMTKLLLQQKMIGNDRFRA